MAATIPTAFELEEARELIKSLVQRTPVITSSWFDRRTGARLHFKCENRQRVGAFKFRGACNAVFSLENSEAERGVVTHSSGNHAQAVALTARERGITAHIVMPENANPVKVAAPIGLTILGVHEYQVDV